MKRMIPIFLVGVIAMSLVLSTERFSEAVYHCGGEDFGNLGGNVKEFAKNIKDFLPDFEKLVL